MKNHLEYKGYLGSIEVDVDESFLYGRLAFIRDVVSYRSVDVGSLRAAFEAAVDDYLATCAELGEVPEVPCKGTFNVRIGPELHQEVALAAAKTGITLNEWVRQACALKIAADKPLAVVQADRAESRRLDASFEDEPYSFPGDTRKWQPQHAIPQKSH